MRSQVKPERMMKADLPLSASLKTALEKAFAHQQANQLDAATAGFQAILAEHPRQADALHGLGMISAQKRDFHQAVHYLQDAIQVAPETPAFHNNLANAYKATGKIDEAFMHYHEALRLKPTYPEAHNNLGALLYRLGNYDQAIEHFQKAIRINPQTIDAHYNLANCYSQINRFLDASIHYQETLRLRPEHLGSLHNLGLVWCNLKQFEKAQPLLEQVIVREPNNIDALFYLGMVYSATGKTEQAQQCYKKVLKLKPDHASAHHNLATVNLSLHEFEQARKHYQYALQYQPDNKTAAHMIDALTGNTSEQGAPLEYTQALFDQYAYSYDQHVKTTLQYQAPALMRESITPFINTLPTPWEALDLGCGTGLCAPFFNDIVSKLYGVDLSTNMLELARLQGGYYKLYNQDILSYLENCEESFELVIAADVFVYFGDLTQVFQKVGKILKPGGLFCFTIENIENTENTENTENPKNPDMPYKLTPTGRYTHQPVYVQTLAEQSHYTVGSTKTAILRHQDESPVVGSIFILRKLL